MSLGSYILMQTLLYLFEGGLERLGKSRSKIGAKLWPRALTAYQRRNDRNSGCDGSDAEDIEGQADL
jgi:hypothetical protein